MNLNGSTNIIYIIFENDLSVMKSRSILYIYLHCGNLRLVQYEERLYDIYFWFNFSLLNYFRFLKLKRG